MTEINAARKFLAAIAGVLAVVVSQNVLHGTAQTYVSEGSALLSALLVYWVPNGPQQDVFAYLRDLLSHPGFIAQLAAQVEDILSHKQPAPVPVTPDVPATPTEVAASTTTTVLPTLDDAPPAWLAPAVAGFLPTPRTAVSEPPSVPAQAS